MPREHWASGGRSQVATEASPPHLPVRIRRLDRAAQPVRVGPHSMKTLLICGALGAAVLAGTVAIACGPMFPKAVFTYARHPSFPRTRYLSGDLGAFLPTYARSYLVIAYRYLNGPALSAVERQQVKEYWKDRESGEWDHTAT